MSLPHTLSSLPKLTTQFSNIPPRILAFLPRKLLTIPHHPLHTTLRVLTSPPTTNGYTLHTPQSPIVSTYMNFDSLNTPTQHPAREKADSYYISETLMLRTHTSAHQTQYIAQHAEIAKSTGETQKFLVAADVYRRDEIDTTHSPAFHQSEGVIMFQKNELQRQIAERAHQPEHLDEQISKTNPIQEQHNPAHAREAVRVLKAELESMFIGLFKAYKLPIPSMRWLPTTFPFTSPSFELEILHEGKWIEMLGCGVTQGKVLANAGVSPTDTVVAFGIGLDRLTMLLYDIPDIRLLWSEDERFLSQWSQGNDMQRFVPFSNNPPVDRDISFWMPPEWQENDMMDIIREKGKDIEVVEKIDQWTDPRQKRTSLTYRIRYRAMGRNLTNAEVNQLQDAIIDDLASKGYEFR